MSGFLIRPTSRELHLFRRWVVAAALVGMTLLGTAPSPADAALTKIGEPVATPTTLPALPLGRVFQGTLSVQWVDSTHVRLSGSIQQTYCHDDVIRRIGSQSVKWDCGYSPVVIAFPQAQGCAPTTQFPGTAQWSQLSSVRGYQYLKPGGHVPEDGGGQDGYHLSLFGFDDQDIDVDSARTGERVICLYGFGNDTVNFPAPLKGVDSGALYLATSVQLGPFPAVPQSPTNSPAPSSAPQTPPTATRPTESEESTTTTNTRRALTGAKAVGGKRQITVRLTLARAATATISVARSGARRSLGKMTMRATKRGSVSRIIKRVGKHRLTTGTYKVRVEVGSTTKTLTVRVK